MLNDVFSRFDALAESLGLEKIKTIGDAYMVAGGLNSEVPDACCRIARLALAMQQAIGERDCEKTPPLALRIGIGTGPVVAGVVGRRSSSTTSGATPSISQAASPRKASLA